MNRFNYIIFDTCIGYYQVVMKDIENLPNVKILNRRIGNLSSFTAKVYRLLTAKAVYDFFNVFKINNPLANFFNKQFCNVKFSEDKELCFIFAGITMNLRNVISYIKKAYPNAKLVYFYRDKVEVNQRRVPWASVEFIKKNFDLVLTYDKISAEKYGFEWFTSIASYVNVKKSEKYPLSDLVFIGLAKDRLSLIHQIYINAVEKGLKCDFYVTGVPESNRIMEDGIVYGDNGIPYEEMLYRTVNSRCVLELSQGGVLGFTSRSFEAFMYNKKLITNNPIVKETRFFNEKYIQYFESGNEINFDFLLDKNEAVDYGYDGEYSPVKMLEKIEEYFKG